MHRFLPIKLNLVIIFDVLTEIALNRGKGAEKFENTKFLDKVRLFFLNMPDYWKDENIKIIDANKGIEEVFESVKEEIDKIIPY